ncbi:MAG: DUF2283 domain-containing protein [Candidatus Pacearchaeota archaeon]
MEQWYDKEEDIFGARLEEGEYWKSVELPNGVVLDLSKNNQVIGIEVHKASKVFSGDIQKVIDSARKE